jgi:hypothetical protein
MHTIQKVIAEVERKRRLSIAELQRLISSFIPESCDECIWLESEARSSCPCSERAPCRQYLNEVLHYLEDQGLI